MVSGLRKFRVWVLAILVLIAIGWLINRTLIDPRNEHGMTPLMQAADRGDTAAVKRLISGRNARINSRVPSNNFAVLISVLRWMQGTPHHDVGWTALVYAARTNCLECVGALLDAGADVNAAGRDGSTALVQATLHGYVPLAEFLMGKGADPKNPRLIYAALAGNNYTLLTNFLARGANPDGLVADTTLYYSKMTPLLVAVHRRDAEAVRILLQAKAHPEPRDPLNNWSALRFAHREGLREIEELLRQAGAKDDGAGEEKLLAAVKKRDAAEVRAALASGANANANDNTGDPLICEAAERGDTEIVTALLEHQANINALNSYKFTPLCLAITFRHPATAALLINSGANIHDQKNNPFFLAVQTGDLETAGLLIGKKADVNFAGGAPTRAAAKNGDLEMVKLLIAHGADVRSSNEQGENALHLAAYKAPPELMRLLLDRGVAVNQKQQNGWTPLVNAAAVGNSENVKILLAAGADPNVKDSDGKSALQHSAHYPEVQAALRAAGAK